MSFSEDVSWLINSGNGKELNGLTSHMLTNEVTVNFNVFRTLVENVIMGNLNGTVVVTP
jgi:hypothetical protein